MFENEPTESCNLGQPIPSLDFPPLGFIFLLASFIQHPYSIFYVQYSKIGVSPPKLVWTLMSGDLPKTDVRVEVFNVLRWCLIFPPVFPFPSLEQLVRGPMVPELLHHLYPVELKMGFKSQNVISIFNTLFLVPTLANEPS